MTSLHRLAIAVTILATTAAADDDLQVASQFDGLRIRPMAALPENSAGKPDTEFCFIVRNPPETDAGREVVAKGWAVTQEITLHDLTFVSFAGNVTPGTSGSCLLENGNLAVYQGDRILALAYADGGSDRSIGTIAAVGDDGLRIWDGEWLSRPMADLRLYDDGLAVLRPVADRDSFCGGAYTVTSLHGLPIHLARIILATDGWQPSIPEQSSEGFAFLRDALVKRGLPEVQECSGTGFGYCAFEYAAQDGTILSVTTAGEGDEGSTPAVYSYGVDCSP